MKVQYWPLWSLKTMPYTFLCHNLKTWTGLDWIDGCHLSMHMEILLKWNFFIKLFAYHICDPDQSENQSGLRNIDFLIHPIITANSFVSNCFCHANNLMQLGNKKSYWHGVFMIVFILFLYTLIWNKLFLTCDSFCLIRSHILIIKNKCCSTQVDLTYLMRKEDIGCCNLLCDLSSLTICLYLGLAASQSFKVSNAWFWRDSFV